MEANRKQIAVFFGGPSIEHEISILTALQAMDAMDVVRYKIIPVYLSQAGRWYTGKPLRDKSFYRSLPGSLSSLDEVVLFARKGEKSLRIVETLEKISIDAAFLCFHGAKGEDGCIQGLFELTGIPYTGSSLTCSAIAMHKAHCKAVLTHYGIPVLPWTVANREECRLHFPSMLKRISEEAGLGKFPLFVKPCHLGSSVGLSKVHNMTELGHALAKVFRFDPEAIIEPCIEDLMEINVSVIGGTMQRASSVEVPVASDKILTYEDKYLRNGGKSGAKSSRKEEGMANLTRVIDPEDLDADIKTYVQNTALHAFKILGCGGVVRFDFMMDMKTGQIVFNELNPLPGSLSYYLWEKSPEPLLYTEIIDILIEEAFHRNAEDNGVQNDFGLKALHS